MRYLNHLLSLHAGFAGKLSLKLSGRWPGGNPPGKIFLDLQALAFNGFYTNSGIQKSIRRDT